MNCMHWTNWNDAFVLTIVVDPDEMMLTRAFCCQFVQAELGEAGAMAHYYQIVLLYGTFLK